jgi:hypothetical protein
MEILPEQQTTQRPGFRKFKLETYTYRTLFCRLSCCAVLLGMHKKPYLFAYGYDIPTHPHPT